MSEERSGRATPPDIDIAALIDRSRLGAPQLGMLLLCGLFLVMDGFDVQAMGYIAPALLAEWSIPRAALGPVFGAGLFGMLVGSLVLSVVADRFGRRPVLIGATLFFAVCMLVTPGPARSGNSSRCASSPASVLAGSCPTRWPWLASTARGRCG